MAYTGRKPSDAALTSADINDGIITPDDLSTGHPTWTTGGNVGIGVTTLNRTLDVQSATNENGFAINCIGTAPNYIADFQDDGISKMRIDSSGNLLVNTTSAIARLTVNGGISASGIYLGGTGSANYLDDYEEGTWTPAQPTVGLSSTNGTYVKIGSMVYAYFSIIYNSNSNAAATGITGLPFTEEAVGGESITYGGYFGYGLAASAVHRDSPRLAVQGTTMFFYKDGISRYTHQDLSTTTIRGMVIYKTAA